MRGINKKGSEDCANLKVQNKNIFFVCNMYKLKYQQNCYLLPIITWNPIHYSSVYIFVPLQT